MEIDSTTSDLIQQIYGELPEVLIQGLEKLSAAPESQSHDELWCERDVVLITYADQVRSSGLSPLQAQKQFLLDHDLEELIRVILLHFLAMVFKYFFHF